MFEYLLSIVIAVVLWGIIKFLCDIFGMDPVQVYLFVIAIEFFVHEVKEARKKQEGDGK